MQSEHPALVRVIGTDANCRLWRLDGTPAKECRDRAQSADADHQHDEGRPKRIEVFRFDAQRREAPKHGGRSTRTRSRFPLRLPGELRHGGNRHPVTTADISAHGASLRGAPALPAGSLARLTLEPSDDLSDYPLTAWAEVRGCCSERRMLFVRFVSLRRCDGRRLSRLIELSAARRIRRTSRPLYRSQASFC